MIHRLITGMPAVAALTGCMSLSGLGGDSHYACKAPKGVACESVSGNYANAGAGLPIGKAGSVSSDAIQASVARPRRPGVALSLDGPNLAAGPSAERADALSPLRSAPRVLRMWIKPWEDADRDLNDQGYVYLQVDSGRWLIEHAQREIRNAYTPIRSPARLTQPQTAAEQPSGPSASPAIGRQRGQASPSMATPSAGALDPGQ